LSAESLDAATALLPGGLYTTFRTYSHGQRVWGLQSHLNRLYLPAAQKGIVPALSQTELRQILVCLLDSAQAVEWRVRLILSESDQAGACFAVIEPFFPPPASLYQIGVRVVTVAIHRSTPRLKTTAFIAASARARQLLTGGIYEAVMMRPDGCALECLTSNFYLVRGATLVTARDGILRGVTRRAVLHLVRQIGLKIDYQPPCLKTPYDEAFLTSSSRGVVPIVEIDGQPVAGGKPGPIAVRLNALYQTYVERNATQL